MSSQKKTDETPATRSFYRYEYISDLSITYEGYGDEVRLHTPDISPEGMFIHTSQNLPQGAVIRVKFRLKRSNFEVVARSEVRYCLPGVGVGVEFVEISPEAQQAIEDELAIGDLAPRNNSKNVAPYHTNSPDYPPQDWEVYHNHDNCSNGKRIMSEHKLSGTGGKPRCTECIKLG